LYTPCTSDVCFFSNYYYLKRKRKRKRKRKGKGARVGAICGFASAALLIIFCNRSGHLYN
jgi:hypothetical protein